MVFYRVFLFVLSSSLLLICSFASAQRNPHSAARKWNEVLLFAIKNDFARPTVHARNLFHTSMAMYDAWAVYDQVASTYFLNHEFRGYYAPFTGMPIPVNVQAAQEEAMSYAAYRLLVHRFKNSPGWYQSESAINDLFREQGYDASFTSTDYKTGGPAALGNYIAEKVIEYGYRDGANEDGRYQNKHYLPSNKGMNPFARESPLIQDPNLWQPLALPFFIDQGGTPLNDAPPFLTPEWGKVIPFALTPEDLYVYNKGGNEYWVYHDPGPPPKVNRDRSKQSSDAYLWSFSLVSIWGAHLDPNDGVMIDISPASMGNITEFPTEAEMKDFYRLDGGDPGTGYAVNPHTGAPYEPQIVPRGDYARVLAEYWADGPNSETPPGHWFSILNHVNDHPLFQKRMGGEGPILDDLEWDVKSYFVLGGAVHDAAITAWGIKGYYDYIRPISAIRYMAEMGQSSDPNLPRYHPSGIPLVKGFIELVQEGDPLAHHNPGNGFYQPRNINKIKLYTWRGHNHMDYFERKAGVGWIMAHDWWPYQSSTFVTPPFAGYISGHSTFSRAAAEVMTLLTGDEFFPGGMGEFPIEKDKYDLFERSPSVDLVLQWAKYKDAADQCSLSRIWGGIHPPIDDIPGRIIGQKIGTEAYSFASQYYKGAVQPEKEPDKVVRFSIYPNPVSPHVLLKVKPEPFMKEGKIHVMNMMGQLVYEEEFLNNRNETFDINLKAFSSGVYILTFQSQDMRITKRFMVE